jgi:putative DNA primase/helicase
MGTATVAAEAMAQPDAGYEALPEISWALRQEIASLRRIVGNSKGDPLVNFERACVALLQHGAQEPEPRAVIVDALHDMAVIAGIDGEVSQSIMNDATKAPKDGRPRRGTDASRCKLVSRRASDIAPESVEYIWPGRIARGKHTTIGGEPGSGKSQITIDITATVTTGGTWPCGEGHSPVGNVILFSAEDGAADTIVPRLIAAGADRERVHIVSGVRNADGSRRALDLQSDLALLEQTIIEIGDVMLIVIDPVSSYLGRADSHKNAEVRGVLEPISEMAERTRVAVLSVTHFSKTGANTTTKALHRFIGSIAFTGAPRAAFAVVDDAEHDGRRLFLHAKNNLSAEPQGLAYRLEQRQIDVGIIASRIVWDGAPVAMTANDAMAAEAAGTEARTAKAEAIEFLQVALANGSLSAAEANRMARDHGLSAKALRSARETIGVRVERDGFGPGSQSCWSLPS